MKIENGKVYINSPFDGELVLELKEFELVDGCYMIPGFSLPADLHPDLDREWKALYPNGKPLPTTETPTPPQPTETELLHQRIEQLEKEAIAAAEMNITLYEMILNSQGGN